jgi:ribosomal protein S15P/S13E
MRAIPVDGRAYLRHKRVEGIERAYEELTLLYQPRKDMVELQLDFLDLKQKEGEDMVAFAGRLSEAARDYEAIGVHSVQDQEKLVMQQFKRSVRDSRVRDRLIDVDCDEVTLTALIHKAQKLEKHFEESELSGRGRSKLVRGVEQKGELELLKDELATIRQEQTRALAEAKMADNNFQSTLQDIRSQLQKLKFAPGSARKPKQGSSPFQGKCFRCGEVGHLKRNCRSRLPTNSQGKFVKETVVVQATDDTPNDHLNYQGQR